MSLIELSEYVKRFEETLKATSGEGVSTSASASTSYREGEPSTSPEGKYYFTFAFGGGYDSKALRQIRRMTRLRLMEAARLLKSGGEIGGFVEKATAEKAAESLRSLGATVEAPHRKLTINASDVDADVLLDAVEARMQGLLSAAKVTRIVHSERASEENVPRMPDAVAIRRLGGLLQVTAAFTSMWSSDLLEPWLFAPNAHLDDATPADLIAMDNPTEVLFALDDAAYGTYA